MSRNQCRVRRAPRPLMASHQSAGQLVVLAALASVVPMPAHAQTWSSYSGYTQSYTLPYASGGSAPDGAISVDVSVGSYSGPVRLDTGSRGLWMNAKYAPPNYKSGTPGYLFYWSSGHANIGYWYPAKVTLTNAVAQGGAAPTATATVPVLFVDRVQCLAGSWPNACPSPGKPQPVGDGAIGMMGIGFDRTGHGTGYGNSTPNPTGPGTSDNLQILDPFLNLSDMQAGTMRAGYILSRNGITLGLTTENTASGANGGASPYAYAKLLPTGRPPVKGAPADWRVMAGSVVLGGRTYESAQAVVDVGIPNALLATSDNAALPGQIAKGKLSYLSSASGKMQINLLGLPGMVGYSFSVPNPGKMPSSNPGVTPTNIAVSEAQEVWWTGESPDTLINTGIYALNAFNYLYDATDGYIGLQRNGTPAAASAFFQPVIAAIGTLSLPNGFQTDLPLYLRGDVTLDTPGAISIAGNVSGPGRLTISGGGSVTLAGSNAIEGGTVVQSGTLHLTGRLTGSVAVQPGGSFVNDGHHDGALTGGGTTTSPVHTGAEPATAAQAQ